MKIGLDLDGCVVNLVDPLLSIINKKTGKQFTPLNITKYKIEQIPEIGLSQSDISAIINGLLADQSNLPAYPGALGFIYQYYYTYASTPLLFVTARDIAFKAETKRWIEGNLPGLEYELVMATHNKQQLCINHKLSYFVEDNIIDAFPRYDNDFDTTIFIPVRPWNTNVKIPLDAEFRIIKFYHWNTLYRLFCRTKLLHRGY